MTRKWHLLGMCSHQRNNRITDDITTILEEKRCSFCYSAYIEDQNTRQYTHALAGALRNRRKVRDARRNRILAYIIAQPRTINELTALLSCSIMTVYRDCKELRRLGLVEARKRHKHHIYVSLVHLQASLLD